jgi:hypothetical protein
VNTDDREFPAWWADVHNGVMNWEKPSASSGSAGGQGSCIEIGSRGSGPTKEIFIRDTKDAGVPAACRPVLRFTPDEVAAWVKSAGDGQFDKYVQV